MTRPGEAWCSQHAMHPDKCFDLHRPDVHEVKGSLDPEEHQQAIVDRHLYLQEHPEEVRTIELGEKLDPSDA